MIRPVLCTVMHMCLFAFCGLWALSWDRFFYFQIPVENKSIFSGSLLQYLEESKKWRNHFLFVPDSYNISYYDNKAVSGPYSLFQVGAPLIHCLTC